MAFSDTNKNFFVLEGEGPTLILRHVLKILVRYLIQYYTKIPLRFYL